MSYYDLPSSWQLPVRQSSWDQPQPPSRSGTSSVTSSDVDSRAFGPQFEEVERAMENLMKSGKLFSGPYRREGGSGPQRNLSEYDPRMGGPSRHHSMDFDPVRSHSASNLQNYYANARYQPRHTEVDQMQQAKRRMAAQRERELRNYHQEQQYNRSVSSQSKSDRSVSPSAMNEEERRELIARQRRALYGGSSESGSFYDGNNAFKDDGQTPRPGNIPVTNASGRGPSPITFAGFGAQDQNQAGVSENETGKGPSPNASGPRSRANSNSSPASNAQNFSLFEPTTTAAQQSSRTSNSSPGGSPPRTTKSGAAPAPIGTRPVNPALNKRTTPPASSPLSYGFAPSESAAVHGERTGSAVSNPAVGADRGNATSNANWGGNGGVWGKGNFGNVPAPVWG